MRRRRYVVAVCGVAGMVLGGCGSHRTTGSDLQAPRELTGHYTSGPRESWFRSCEADSADVSWWVTMTGRAVEQSEALRADGQLVAGKRYFVRWRATVTTDGQIGPNGPGVPALLVREVLVLRPAAEGDCGDPSD